LVARRQLNRLRHETWVLIRERRITERTDLLTDKTLAQLNLRSHLDLVATREGAAPGSVLKFPDGRRPVYPFGDWRTRKPTPDATAMASTPSKPNPADR
jgi:hypothetical protein